MTVTVAIAGDTMLGRSVARTLTISPPEALVAPEVRAAMRGAMLARCVPALVTPSLRVGARSTTCLVARPSTPRG